MLTYREHKDTKLNEAVKCVHHLFIQLLSNAFYQKKINVYHEPKLIFSLKVNFLNKLQSFYPSWQQGSGDASVGLSVGRPITLV